MQSEQDQSSYTRTSAILAFPWRETARIGSGLWWLIHKDLISEYRAKRTLPTMFLIGLIVAVVFTMQLELAPLYQKQISGAMLWMSVFFGGLVAIDRSCASEKDAGCWDGLFSYPVSPSVVFWAKLLVNLLAFFALECLLIPVFFALSGIDLLHPWWAISLVCALANLGFCSVGTLFSALSNGIQQGGQLLVLLVLPMMVPVVLSAAEATRLIAIDQIEMEFWRWIQLLGGFAVVFLTAGTILFEYVIED